MLYQVRKQEKLLTLFSFVNFLTHFRCVIPTIAYSTNAPNTKTLHFNKYQSMLRIYPTCCNDAAMLFPKTYLSPNVDGSNGDNRSGKDATHLVPAGICSYTTF